jgi:hypothetical protein
MDQMVVGDPAWVKGLWRFGFPVLGLGAGGLVRWGADWVASLPWAPLQGPFKALASLPEPWTTLVALVLGAAAGLYLTYEAEKESLTVTLDHDLVTLTRFDCAPVALPRASVAGGFLDGKQLVLLGRAGEELARERHSELDPERLRVAFTTHGYRWHADGDPYRDDYRRWVPGVPDLPAGADAVLKAREQALRKGEHGDAAELRAELGKLGVVVREEKHRQYLRRV